MLTESFELKKIEYKFSGKAIDGMELFSPIEITTEKLDDVKDFEIGRKYTLEITEESL